MVDFRLHHKIRGKLQRLCGGETPARVSKRARILLCSEEGLSIDEIAEEVGCGTATVKRIRKRFRERGYEYAISDASRSGRPKKLSDSEERRLIAQACSSPPDGQARWTIRLLAKHCPNDIGHGTVQRILKADGLKPWREKNVVCSDD